VAVDPTVNGSAKVVVQSSQWFPMSMVPGTIDCPVSVVIT
jgi:hypothetical protein